MTNTVSATDLKNKAADVLNRVVYAKSEMIIVRHGKPVAVISPFKKEILDKVIDKKILNDSFGVFGDFPEATGGMESKKGFFKLAGILSDSEAKRMKKIVTKGRKDGSRYKKFLLTW